MMSASNRNLLTACLAVALFTLVTSQMSWGARPLRPANPRGVADPRGLADPRGVTDPRGVADPRVAAAPRATSRYLYALPAGCAAVQYDGERYYKCGGDYYYLYYVDGRPVYVLAPEVDGKPTVPPPP